MSLVLDSMLRDHRVSFFSSPFLTALSLLSCCRQDVKKMMTQLIRLKSRLDHRDYYQLDGQLEPLVNQVLPQCTPQRHALLMMSLAAAAECGV